MSAEVEKDDTKSKLNPSKLYKDMEAPKVARYDKDLPDASTRNPGSGTVNMDQSFSAVGYRAKQIVSEQWNRADDEVLSAGVGYVNPMELSYRPPKWLINRNVAIDGTPLTVEEKGAEWWEHRYRKELMIGDELVKQKYLKFEEHQTSSMFGDIRKMQRFFGLQPNLKDEEEVKSDVAKSLGEEDKEREKLELSRKDGSKFGDATWDELISDLEQKKPLAVVAKKVKPQVDFYSIDQFLDSAPTVAWSTGKLGMMIGLLHGGARAIKTTQVDAQFLRASGVGIMSVVNVAMLSSMAKWGGNCCLFSMCFMIGDRVATLGKTFVLPDHEALQRSPVNYSAGLACAFAAVGVVPYWMLKEVGMAARVAVNGLVIGSILGYGVGMTMAHLVSAAVERLQAKPRELRRYQALMKRSGKLQKRIMDRRYEVQAVTQ